MATRGPNWLSLMVAMVAAVVVVTEVETNRSTAPENYQALAGHQIWETEDRKATSMVAGLENDGLADILSHASSVLRFRVFPESHLRASNTLIQAGVDYRVVIPDLERHFVESTRLERREASNMKRQSCTSNSCPTPLLDKFMKFEEIEWYLQELAAQSPRVEVKSIGKSHEGRDIWRVHIKSTEDGVGKRKAVWLEGGLHAREWISPAVAVNLIDIIANDETFLAPGMDVYVVPMANPDGYVHTWTKDRLWRKNRRQHSRCPGVDLNRNWDEKFGVGASNNPCSETYKGPSAFSEPETKALKNEMTSVAANSDLRLMVALHSYGQVLLYPWGWTTDPAPNRDKMIEAGRAFVKAAYKIHGSKYNVVNSAGGFYYASGSTDDWAKAKLETPYSYTLELPDEGRYGFTLPAGRILFTVQEVRRGIKVLISKALTD